VVDLDPQAGITSLLLDRKISEPTIAEILDSESRGTSSAGLFPKAIRRSRYSDQIFVVPSGAALAYFATFSSLTPPNLLAQALQTAPILENTPVIMDTGIGPALVRLGIAVSGWLANSCPFCFG
jgi:cellulose biosynthesis protein BcsQ